MYNIPKEYLTSNNDFGFTAVDEQEVAEPIITDVKTATAASVEKTVEEISSKLAHVEQLVMPLLVNLLKDADTKEYIKWPNRRAILEDRIQKILKITRS